MKRVLLVALVGVLATGAHAAMMGVPGDGIPDVFVWPGGFALLDTDGQDLSGITIRSAGPNGVITPLGDGDGLLLPNLPPIGPFFFNNSSQDEYSGAFGLMPAGRYQIGHLLHFAPKPLTQEGLEADLQVIWNGFEEGGVILIPEPATLGVLALGGLGLIIRRR